MGRAEQQDDNAALLGGHRPAILIGVGRHRKELGALGKQGQPFEPMGQRLAAAIEGGFEQAKPPLVENKPLSRDPRHRARRGVVGVGVSHHQHARRCHGGMPNRTPKRSVRAPMTTMSAYTPAMRSSTMTPSPPEST